MNVHRRDSDGMLNMVIMFLNNANEHMPHSHGSRELFLHTNNISLFG